MFLTLDRWVCELLNRMGVKTPLFQPDNQVRVFARCVSCSRVYPHWFASMTRAEVKQRGFIGCPCGNLRIQPTVIPGWQAFYWLFVRGWLVRKVILGKDRWDPRLPILEKDMA